MSTPVVYIALLLHCIGKNATLLICFWKVPLKGGGGLVLLKFFVAWPESGFRLLLSSFTNDGSIDWAQDVSHSFQPSFAGHL